MHIKFRTGLILLLPPLCFLASLMPGAWPNYSWELRTCGVALWVLGTLLQWQRRAVGSTWLLGTIVILFYCLFPLAMEFMTSIYPELMSPAISWGPFLGNYGFYFRNSSAELWVWRFILALNAVMLILSMVVERPSKPPIPSDTGLLLFRHVWLYRGFLAGVALTSVFLRLVFPAKEAIVHDIIFPISLFSLGFASLGLVRGSRDKLKDLAIGIVLLISCATLRDGKLVFLFVLGVSPLIIFKVRRKVFLLIPLVLIAVTMCGVVYVHSIADVMPGGGHDTFESSLYRKVFTRQYVTLRCYNGALTAPMEQVHQFGPLSFFGSALVPHVLWPEKPSISLGQDYRDLYCGQNCCQTMVASITTLGEPWLHGKEGMTFVAIGMICILLLVVDIATARAPPPLAAIALAINSWVLDFDLHFSLWLALVVKGVLLMSPLACWLLWQDYRATCSRSFPPV